MDHIKSFLNEVQKYRIVSIIGLAKNVSKTTTLNFLINRLKSQLTLGLTSIGRDGESYDVLTKLPKPKIFVTKGIFIATAEQIFLNFKDNFEIIEETNYNTPMGRILLLKVVKDIFIELAGPSINKQLQAVCKTLLNKKCDLVLIDGAFDRKAYATPKISEATILSTGASVSPTLQKVVDLTTHTVRILTLKPEVSPQILGVANTIVKTGKVGVIYGNGTFKLLDLKTSLGGANEVLKHIQENITHVVINGVITDLFLENIMNHLSTLKSIIFLVEDATKLFLSPRVFHKFNSKEGNLRVINPIKLIALTINPTSPYGYAFEKQLFMDMLKKKIELPIYNLG